MPPARAPLCHALAVATGVLTYLGTLAIEALARGDAAGIFGREVIDLAAYWYFGLPACYLAAGVLGYLGRERSWRWSPEMLATHALCTLLLAGSSLNLWPLALGLTLILSLPGLLTGWLGSLAWRLRSGPRAARR